MQRKDFAYLESRDLELLHANRVPLMLVRSLGSDCLSQFGAKSEPATQTTPMAGLAYVGSLKNKQRPLLDLNYRQVLLVFCPD